MPFNGQIPVWFWPLPGILTRSGAGGCWPGLGQCFPAGHCFPEIQAPGEISFSWMNFACFVVIGRCDCSMWRMWLSCTLLVSMLGVLPCHRSCHRSVSHRGLNNPFRSTYYYQGSIKMQFHSLLFNIGLWIHCLFYAAIHFAQWQSTLGVPRLGHSTSNEQIFRNPHALCLRILFNFFEWVAQLSKWTNPKFELPTPNSFSVKIISVTHGRARLWAKIAYGIIFQNFEVQ